MKEPFRARLERLTAEEIHAGAPAIAIMLALTKELERVGIIAAAARDMDHEDLRRARAHSSPRRSTRPDPGTRPPRA